ncbi:MAG: protein-disulfide reductase DsbD [Acidiferrobacterales bacterium]
MKKILITLALLVNLPAQAISLLGAQDELLEPDKAFALTTRVVDGNTLEASWDIAKGYYLYRDKFKFDVIKGKTTVLTPQMPKGKKKNDLTFGVVETYVKSVAIKLPLTRANTNGETLTLRITSQGCNDPVGVCYPPIIKKVTFNLPAITAAALAPKIDSLSALKQLVQPGGLGREFLHPDKAFGVELSNISERKLRAHFRIADGYYLYRNKFSFRVRAADGSRLTAVKLGKVELPRGKKKEDPTYGMVEVYTRSFDLILPFKVSSGDSIAAILNVGYQGCADKGICYPPAAKKISLTISNGAITVDTTATTGDSRLVAPPSTSTGKAGNSISSGEYWLAILGAFGVGLLLTFTPCVLPMIPILSSIIVGQGGKQVTRMRGGGLAAIYVLGTIVTYAISGAVAGSTGDQLQSYFQNTWAISIFSFILVLLALSMFGFYELQMPSFIQSRLQARSQKLRGGSIVGVFLMGIISALIVGACVSPLLISILAVAIKIGDPVLGALIMSSMAVGMGVILVGIGFGAAFLTPKAGVWMDRVKYFFGVLLLGVAVYLLGVLPDVPVMFLWAALFIVASIYLGAIEPLPEGAGGWHYFFKGLGMVLLVWGIFALIGAFSGNRDILRPISMSAIVSSQSATVSSARPAAAHVFQRVGSLAELDTKLAQAKSEGRGVMLDYFATWCTDCVRMEKTTFADPDVVRILNGHFISLQVDVTDPNNADTRAIKKRYGVFGPPAILFFGTDGVERKDLNFYGYKSAKEFLKVLNSV